MPTYLNHGSYMKMNNFHKPSPPSDFQNSVQSPEHNCLQILNHVQNCPICRYVFSPHDNVLNGLKHENGVKSNFVGSPKKTIEISFTSMLFLISVFIVLILLILKR